MPKAFIFDLDGVITDTAEYHYLAWKNLAATLGIQIDRAFNENLKGVSREESFERILVHGGKSDRFTPEEKAKYAYEKNEEYKRLIKQVTPNDVLPGIVVLLDALKDNGIHIGLASASKNAFEVIDRLELEDYFEYIADAAKIENSKPAPDVFLDVMNHFGLSAKDCIGVEDAQAGIEAIKKAGMYAVGIGKSKDLVGADLVFDKTNDIDLDVIIRHYMEKQG